jgi:signal transduction histidine kinase
MDRRARYAPVAAVTRGLALLALAPPVAFSFDPSAILNILLLATVWLGAVFVDGLIRTPTMTALVVEASLISMLAMLTIDTSPALLPALIVPAFIGGLVGGVRRVMEVLGAEIVVCGSVLLASADIQPSTGLAVQLVTAFAAASGAGGVAAVIHSIRTEPDTTSTSYRDARALLARLQSLSGSLVSGLDPVEISRNIADLAREELPLTGAVVYAETPHGPVPLVEGDLSDAGADNAHILEEVFRTGRPVFAAPWVGVPLKTEAGTIAAITGGIHPARGMSTVAIRQTLDQLVRILRPEALQLDTALLFASLRDEATTEERRRIARDLHDGVAQDLASLGYLIDDITETTSDPKTRASGKALRDELTRVVAELRRSVFLLRNESLANSLGVSVQALASHIESHSHVRVSVALDEGSRRLRPDVEGELLRIAQEGMNNAVKHAAASQINVSVVIHAPDATITVVDDGRGLQQPREDSHGVRIMRERARRIGADLTLRSRDDASGTELRVVLANTSRQGAPGTREGIAS